MRKDSGVGDFLNVSVNRCVIVCLPPESFCFSVFSGRQVRDAEGLWGGNSLLHVLESPLLACIAPEIREMDLCNCSTSGLGLFEDDKSGMWKDSGVDDFFSSSIVVFSYFPPLNRCVFVFHPDESLCFLVSPD